MYKPFHLSLGVHCIDESVAFYCDLLGGKVTHRDETGYVNIELLGSQITLKANSRVSADLPDFHFGFNMGLNEFQNLWLHVSSKASEVVQMPPKIVDQGTLILNLMTV